MGETLDGVSGDRKCFRMVGGVLVERTVKEVVPALINNRDKMAKLIESLKNNSLKKARKSMVTWRSTIFSLRTNQVQRKKMTRGKVMLSLEVFWCPTSLSGMILWKSDL